MGQIKILQETEPFNLLPESVFEAFRQAAVLKKFPPYAHIFKQADPPTGYLYVIKEGMVEIVALTPGGVEMVVDYRHEGQFFGGTPIFTGEPYTAGARTVRATECYLIPAQLLKQAERDYPQLREYFTRVVLSRVKDLYSDMVTEHSKKALIQVEAFPFQKRLSEIMSTPVEACGPNVTAQQVARQMSEKNIGSVLVLDESGAPVGLITEKDIITRVVVPDGVDCTSVHASEIMTRYPHAMSPDRYMYEAMAYMLAHKIRHLPIIVGGKPAGMVTMRDLMRFRSQKAMLLVGSIREAKTLEDLVTIRAEMVKVAKALQGETRSTFETMEILSYIHHHLLQRCHDLILEQMKEQGITPPDIRYALIIMGSGGRREMLLGPDQDNGIIFEDFPDARLGEVEGFFVPFAEKLVAAYDRIGYPLCNGEVMVNNPLWRGRLREWKKRVSGWISVPEPKRVMYSTIFFDFRPLVGDPSLCSELRDTVHSEIRANPRFLYHLLENDLKHKPPISLLGRFVLEKSGEHKGQLSLKQAGSVFIIDCIRIFALERGINAATTLERLQALVKEGVFDPDTAEHIKAALESFTFLRLRHEISLLEQGEGPSHYINPHSLSKNEQDLLKEAFRVAGKLQESTRRHFGHGVL